MQKVYLHQQYVFYKIPILEELLITLSKTNRLNVK